MIAACSITAAAQKTVYMSKQGVDNSTCGTLTSPCASFKEAVARIANGDPIAVYEGDFPRVCVVFVHSPLIQMECLVYSARRHIHRSVEYKSEVAWQFFNRELRESGDST